MQQMNYLDGYIYHMVHFANLRSIFAQGMILSQEMLSLKGIVPRSIANSSVQKLRERIFIWSIVENRYRSLHSYVPFYFSTRPPMLHVQGRDRMLNQLVIFEVSRSILQDQGVVFTDGNATNQQLSDVGIQRVKIIPTTVHYRFCRRTYYPYTNPRGTNVNRSNFYCGVEFLSELDWDGINNKRYIPEWEEYKRIRSAEALIPDSLPIERIEHVAVNTNELEDRVNDLIIECGVAGCVPFATRDSSLFLS